ncbi:MAG: DegT/DnrJ/EryC1/StrS family aminotransferase, partial [Pirellulaceae bacterium]
PLHLQQCFRHLEYREGMLPNTEAACREILHLPIYPELRLDEHHRVCEGLKSFFQAQSLRRAA